MANKYFAKATTYDSIRFHSFAERNRYIFLKNQQSCGYISELKLQVPFVLSSPLEIKYIADFTYIKEGQLVVEDVKNPVLAREALSVVKKKLMSNVHDIKLNIVDPSMVGVL